MARDDFSQATKRLLERQAGAICSNPDCCAATVGASMGDEEAALNLGEAAHITAASPGFARYDESLTSEQRSHVSNGLWLCRVCARAIDRDEKTYPVEKLKSWKEQARQRSFDDATLHRRPLSYIAEVQNPQTGLAKVHAAALADVAAFKHGPRWPAFAVALSLHMFEGDERKVFDATGLAAASTRFTEIAVIAPPGMGKSTTLVQFAEAVLELGNVAIVIPLGEWSTSAASLLEHVIERRAFSQCAVSDFAGIADAGRLYLALDGWNELDGNNKARLAAQVSSLRRDYPQIGILVSTRRSALDVPVAGPRVEIELLNDDQQFAIAEAARGEEGRRLVDQAWRTAGLRELVSIPLYLSALLQLPGNQLPTTKEEVLSRFAAEHEQRPASMVALRTTLASQQKDYLKDLAVAATNWSNTSISTANASATVAATSGRLTGVFQMKVPAPTQVLDVLVEHHGLTLSGTPDGNYSFQHQQLQEWYASFEVDQTMRQASLGDADAVETLRSSHLNIFDWEEPVLFACERLSRGGGHDHQAVAGAIFLAMEIDPMLASQMIFRSSAAVWEIVKAQVIDYCARWHTTGKADRATKFMVQTGKAEFADKVWAVIETGDRNDIFGILRDASRFRIGVLGPAAAQRAVALPDEVRRNVLAEIASQSDYEGLEFAATLTKQEANPEIVVDVVQSLAFRRADRFVTGVLDGAGDAVFTALAAKGYPEQLTDQVQEERREQARIKLVSETSDQVSVLWKLLYRSDGVVLSSAVLEQAISSEQFDAKNQRAGALLSEAAELDLSAVTKGLVGRLKAGLALPFRIEQILRSQNLAIDDGPVARMVIDRTAEPRIVEAAIAAVGPKTLRRLIDELAALALVPRTDTKADEVVYAKRRALVDLLVGSSADAFVDALLARPAEVEPRIISVLADLIARHGNDPSVETFAASQEAKQRLRAKLQDWGATLLSNESATSHQFGELARAIGRVPASDVLDLLDRMLSKDLAITRAQKAEAARQRAAGKGGVTVSSGSHTGAYRQAFAAIGGSAVAGLMIAKLGDIDFGFEAALVLLELWEHEAGVIDNRRGFGGIDFSAVRQRSLEFDEGGEHAAPHPFAKAIFEAVEGLLATDRSPQEHAFALKLAKSGFFLPCGKEPGLQERLFAVPGNRGSKRDLLLALVLRGETISADRIDAGLDDLFEEAKSHSWVLKPDGYEWPEWLILYPFSDRPRDVLSALKRFDPSWLGPWKFRSLLSALGHSPSPDADVILRQLAIDDPRYRGDFDWLIAFQRRGTLASFKYLLELLAEGPLPGVKDRHDGWTLANHFGGLIKANPAFRRELYAAYRTAQNLAAIDTFETAIVEVADDVGVIALIEGYARRGKSYDGLLGKAVEQAVTRREPPTDGTGVYEIISAPVPGLRKMLFQWTIEDSARGRLARRCLEMIDRIRDGNGPAEGEPRHPDIASGRPWPLAIGGSV